MQAEGRPPVKQGEACCAHTQHCQAPAACHPRPCSPREVAGGGLGGGELRRVGECDGRHVVKAWKVEGDISCHCSLGAASIMATQPASPACPALRTLGPKPLPPHPQAHLADELGRCLLLASQRLLGGLAHVLVGGCGAVGGGVGVARGAGARCGARGRAVSGAVQQAAAVAAGTGAGAGGAGAARHAAGGVGGGGGAGAGGHAGGAAQVHGLAGGGGGAGAGGVASAAAGSTAG